MTPTGPEIAAAFNTQNDKRTWKARSLSRTGSNTGDVVHFESNGGMVALMYYVEEGQFAVKFNKFQGAWGDYIKAIARSLFTVLNTLKSAGMPFDAPVTLAGMKIECTTTDDNLTRVSWPGQTPVLTETETADMVSRINANQYLQPADEPQPQSEADAGRLPPVL